MASIGTVGDSYDNAMAESVIGLYKLECVSHDGPWRTDVVRSNAVAPGI